MPIHDYAASEFEPRHLTEQEIREPLQFIHQLFDYAHLPQWREQLGEQLRIMVCGSFHAKSRKERENIVQFYEMIERLIEVAHILHRREG